MNRKDFDKAFEVLFKRHLDSRSSGLDTGHDCPDENAVIAYLEGQLPLEFKLSFERHAARCSRCQEELAALLQAGMPLAEDLHDALRSTRKNGILHALASLLRGFHVWRLRPALAMLLIVVVSGYIGYDIYLQKSPHQHPETDQLLIRSKEALPVEPPSSAEHPIVVAQSPIEAHSSRQAEAPQNPTFAARQSGPHAVAQPTGASRVAQATNSSKPVSTALPEAPTPVPEMSENEKATTMGAKILDQEEPRKDLFAPAIASETLTQKGLLQNRTASLKTGDSSAQTRNLATEGKSAISVSQDEARSLKSDSLRAGTSGQPGSDEAKRAEVAGSPVGFAKKAKANLAAVEAKQEAQETPPLPEGSRLETAGKVFILRNQVWTDLSIPTPNNYERVFISRHSSSFSELVKPLAAYQKLLSRPEDVLVLHEGKIYWISNRSEPPENL